MKSQLHQVLAIVLIAIGVFLLSQATVQNYEVKGSSMEPSFEHGQRLLVNKAVYHFREPQRGEVIVFQPPGGSIPNFTEHIIALFTRKQSDIPLIKRIIALPGDTIEIKEGKVYVNGQAIDEPYIKAAPSYTMTIREIPEGEYFALGDNRNNSYDSHSWGTLPQENIIGKVWISIWPPGTIPSYTLAD
jgi:signal peptidase I